MGGNPLGMLKISSYFFCNWSNSGQSSFTNSIRTIYHSALGIPIALKSIRNTWSLGCHVLTNIFNYTSICDKNGSPFKITLVSPTEKVTINSFQSTSIALVYIATTYPEPYPSCQAPRVGSLPRWLSLEDPPWPRAHSFPCIAFSDPMMTLYLVVFSIAMLDFDKHKGHEILGCLKIDFAILHRSLYFERPGCHEPHYWV